MLYLNIFSYFSFSIASHSIKMLPYMMISIQCLFNLFNCLLLISWDSANASFKPVPLICLSMQCSKHFTIWKTPRKGMSGINFSGHLIQKCTTMQYTSSSQNTGIDFWCNCSSTSTKLIIAVKDQLALTAY